MICYIEGKLLKKEDDRVVVLAHGVGYEILLPSIVRQSFNGTRAGEEGETVRLHISYQQSERQPRPLLIGFNTEPEKEFFEKLITVGDIGPTTAVKALTVNISYIAAAIENRDAGTIQRLKGIGPRTAEKIIAALHGRVGKFALMREERGRPVVETEDLSSQVEKVLVRDLGHRVTEARRMVEEALRRNPSITTPEELFEEVYRGEKRPGESS
ncbi:MAG: Holliday junction DNA helicase RuvA [Deltaproteobacteria bacterium]|nr:Holliday junction DNA helicase RuvA [Deltaproteobacteria bacterium]MBW2121598.1 Holliday junction DNA helicase RuvA [Deltaproteobacteria bacterium]